MIHAVIFDLDGVLLDTEKYLVKYWCQAANEMGFPMERKHALMIRSLAAKYAEPYLQQELSEHFDYDAVRQRRRELMEEAIERDGVPKKADADYILDELRKRKIKTAVATATDEARAERYLKQIGIYEKIDHIVCATMVQNGKPMPDVYLYACKTIGEKTQDCLAIEDSPNGVLSATRAGLKTIMVPDLTPPDDELKSILYGTAETLAGVLDFIE